MLIRLLATSTLAVLSIGVLGTLYTAGCNTQSPIATAKASPGLTLIPQEGNARVLLVDMEGKTVRQWEVDTDRARLLPGCRLLALHGTKWGVSIKKWRALRNTVVEYDRDGKVVWQYVADGVLHHDLQRLDDGTTVVLKRTLVPEDVRMSIKNQNLRRMKIRGDSVLMISPQGEVTYTWHAHEHLDIKNLVAGGGVDIVDTDGGKHRMIDWTHINSVSFLPENRWHRAGDTRFTPGNILIHSRNLSTSFIIDRSSGAVVWEYRGIFKGGIGGGHESHMLNEALPGAGNILIFDNGRVTHSEQSLALEVDPTTKEVVWHYGDGSNFYSKTAGSLQRLANGNTLISEDKRGRIFEVTPAGETVWEYKSKRETSRAKRYPLDICG